MRPWRRNSTSSIMYFIVAVSDHQECGCPYGCVCECSGCYGAVGWADGVLFFVGWVGGACSCDEESVCVDAVWRAGHEGDEVVVVGGVDPFEVVWFDDGDVGYLVCEGFSEDFDGEGVSFVCLVEVGEHEFVCQASVCCDDGVGAFASDGEGCSLPVSGS